jgi:hypothetical protein
MVLVHEEHVMPYIRRVISSLRAGGMWNASKPMSEISSAIFSGVQVSGSNSMTARSASKATLTEWMPGWFLSIPSIDWASWATASGLVSD